ncbi:MAG TPA: flagellar hook-associated protein FlgK [Burkholderiales bacterium]|nr:flagellar hook-associated protein FlgK [Burkholderiales bacterium]
MGTGSIFNIGVSGLNAAQASLAVTSHNIANASTDGYHRQSAIQGTETPQGTGAGFFGRGVDVETVRRAYSQFLDNAVLTAQAQGSYLDTYNGQISQIDNLLADPSAGLSPALQSFFSSVQDVASNPSSVPSRQAMITQGQVLSARFQALDTQLTQMRTGVNQQLTDTVTQINAKAQSIAQLNDQIRTVQSNATQPPNDLLDKRDQLVADLNQLVKTSVVKQSDGSYSVFIGNGQTLVLGNQAYALSAAPSAADPKDYSISYTANGATVPISTSTLQGGSLGALLDFRSQSLDTAQNNLGRVAIVLAQTFNDQHELGQDLNGNLGQAFFNVPAGQVVTNANNTGTAVINAADSSVGALTGSDYRLSFNAGTWTLTRLSDNTTSTFATFPQTVDGVTLSLASGAAANGDSYLIQPTRNGARDISVAIADTSLVAAAAPIRASAAAANTGDGKITAGSVNAPPPPNANLQSPVTITFTSATTFDVTGTGTGNPTGVAYTSNGNITYNGWTVQITGTPAAGDVFTIGPNTAGVADNRNALLLAGLQTVNTVANGTANYQSAYSLIVSSIGNRANDIKVQSTAQTALVQQTTAAQQSLSGVNLDEEAANLIRFQQAYQANGKVIQIASTLFSTILGINS